jgi:hypothetical protein
MWYRAKLTFFKNARLNTAWRRWRAWRGTPPGHYDNLFAYIREFAPRRSFVDIGCMWGVNGAHAFAAEDAGATSVTAVDVFGPTPDFDEACRTRQSRVRFVLGDCTDPAALERIGIHQVVFCAGVLYHHPSPFDLLVALRRICTETLILRTSTIPEIDGLPNAAVYFPLLSDEARRTWDLRSLGLLHQAAITAPFDPADGYGNWFWGLTPSCLVSLLQTAGFSVVRRDHEPFAQTIVAQATSEPCVHRLPSPAESRLLGASISAAGLARPA